MSRMGNTELNGRYEMENRIISRRMETLCRFCLRSLVNVDKLHMFRREGHHRNIVHKILSCLSLIVSDEDALPKYICIPCADKLEDFQEFRDICHKSENFLNRLLSLDELSIEEALPKEERVVNKNRVRGQTRPDRSSTDKVNCSVKVERSEVPQDDSLLDFPLPQVTVTPVGMDRGDYGKTSDVGSLWNDASELVAEVKEDLTDSSAVAYGGKKRRRSNNVSDMCDVVVLSDDSGSSDAISTRDDRWDCVGDQGEENEHRRYIAKHRPPGNNFARQWKSFIQPQVNHHFLAAQLEDAVSPLHKCGMCGGHFEDPSVFEMHITECMSKRPFACNICQARFTMNSILKSHLRIHSGERPFACGTCGRKFCQQGTLRRHMKVHTGDKPHVCKICHRGYTRKYVLERHKILHHFLTTSD